jgi:hypothetical protein
MGGKTNKGLTRLAVNCAADDGHDSRSTPPPGTAVHASSRDICANGGCSHSSVPCNAMFDAEIFSTCCGALRPREVIGGFNTPVPLVLNVVVDDC